jgi:hypothetical protein
MDNLFSNSGFRLILIDDGHMSLITPLEHKEAIKNGYRCISHLWGNATRWHNHPVHDVEWGVDVREEKRDKLLQIFNHFKGYWWMDVFCTDQDSNNKPLSIMGDVYRQCKECICLLDIKIPDFMSQPTELWTDFRKIFKHMIAILRCKWNKRVWTLQEWYLPPKAYYTEEIFKDKLTIIDPDHVCDILGKIRRNHTFASLYLKYGYEHGHSQIFMKRNMLGIKETLIFGDRECKNPEDYYYGVAGVLGIKLTDGLSYREVEEEFLLEFRKDKSCIAKKSPIEKQPYRHWRRKEGYFGRHGFLIDSQRQVIYRKISKK